MEKKTENVEQLYAEEQQDIKAYQIWIGVICALLLFIPLVNALFVHDMFITMLILLCFFVCFLLPPIIIIAAGNLVQKIIHKFANTKYHIHCFPLFLVLTCVIIFLLTVIAILKDLYNHVYDLEDLNALGIATSMLFFAFTCSNNIITKYDDKTENQIKK